ncbi:MAG: hypothetical protein PWP23_2672 [Candidatus Sumerlaeota bacterium]|nr:hypothetical protein [Candidatus Sumerlaeota bacterium]
MSKHFATHGSQAFNDWMEDVTARLAREVEGVLGANLVALVLGGGYGRGEGGVVTAEGTEKPYNDLDFTLIVNDKSALPMAELDAIRHRYEKEIGIDVDFSRPLTPNDVRHWPHWLMWVDLLEGHRVVAGKPDALASLAPPSLREPLPLIEGVRLMLNRGAGLLWAMRILRGAEAAPDADFVRRNYHKCALAMGDMLVIAHGRHRTLYQGRSENLRALAAENADVARFGVQELYDAALRFRLEPARTEEGKYDEEDLCELARRWGSILVYAETKRTGRSFATIDEYVAWKGLREPEQSAPAQWPRNLVRNAQLGVLSWQYPRERLYRTLPVLLGLVPGDAAQWNTHSEQFLTVWKRFN